MERRFTGAGRTRPSWTSSSALGSSYVETNSSPTRRGPPVTTNPTCTVLPARSSAIASTKNSVAEVISCTERQQCEWTMRYASGSNSTSRSLAATSNRIIFQQAMEAHSSARRYSLYFGLDTKLPSMIEPLPSTFHAPTIASGASSSFGPNVPAIAYTQLLGWLFACSRAKSSICMVGSGIPVPYGHPADNTAKFIQHSLSADSSPGPMSGPAQKPTMKNQATPRICLGSNEQFGGPYSNIFNRSLSSCRPSHVERNRSSHRPASQPSETRPVLPS